MKNLILIICLSLWFPSCGYKPLYKVNKKILNYQINVIVTTQQRSIDESMERDKQLLRNFIKSKLNMPNSKPSSLKLIIEMNKSLYGMGIQKDLTTTRNAISCLTNSMINLGKFRGEAYKNHPVTILVRILMQVFVRRKHPLKIYSNLWLMKLL